MPALKRVLFVGSSVFLLVAPAARAQNANSSLEAAREVLAKESYVRPPDAIAKLVTAPRHLNVSLTTPSPDRRHFLKEQSEGMPTVHTYGKPHLYFGGLQVDPAANRARVLTTRSATGLSLIDATTGATTTLETPKGATVSGSAWSPDGKQLAYLANFETATHVFVADVATRKSVQVTKTPLLATLVTAVDWTADGKNLVVVLVPEPRAARPVKPAIATGPQVRVWTDRQASPQRNFWSLLDEPFDMELMEWFVTGQLAVIDVKTKAVRKIGAPAMIQCSRRLAGRPVLPRRHDAEAVLVRRAVHVVRRERRDLGRGPGRCWPRSRSARCARRRIHQPATARASVAAVTRDHVAASPGCPRVPGSTTSHPTPRLEVILRRPRRHQRPDVARVAAALAATIVPTA